MQGMMPYGSGYMGGGGIPALIALAVGYIVCLLANKEKGKLRKAGYVIGIAIIAMSSIIILSKALWIAKKCINRCPIRGSMMPMQPAPMSPRN
ncbi:MAG: hypothetical protein WC301_01595 [Candidatus Omnitrophota bacterium]|jgi:hypothetical protein